MTKKTTLNEYMNGGERAEARDLSSDAKKRITEFLNDNKDFLVVVADPNTNTIIVGYRDQLEAHRVVDKSTGEAVPAVADMLQYKKESKYMSDSAQQFLLVVEGSINDIISRIAQGRGKH